MRNFPYFPENVFISVSLCYSRLRNRIPEHLCVSQCLHGKGEPVKCSWGFSRSGWPVREPVGVVAESPGHHANTSGAPALMRRSVSGFWKTKALPRKPPRVQWMRQRLPEGNLQ